MPIKFTKDVSTHLFKYVRTVGIKFNPFDKRSKTARELLRQVQAGRFKNSNPKLAIDIDIHSRAEKPSVLFAFVDGSEDFFDPHSDKVNDILFQVHLKAMQLDAEYEMAGKSVDDM